MARMAGEISCCLDLSASCWFGTVSISAKDCSGISQANSHSIGPSSSTPGAYSWQVETSCLQTLAIRADGPLSGTLGFLPAVRRCQSASFLAAQDHDMTLG